MNAFHYLLSFKRETSAICISVILKDNALSKLFKCLRSPRSFIKLMLRVIHVCCKGYPIEPDRYLQTIKPEYSYDESRGASQFINTDIFFIWLALYSRNLATNYSIVYCHINSKERCFPCMTYQY